MTFWTRTVLVLVAVLSVQKPFARVTEDQSRAIIESARSQASGDAEKFIELFRKGLKSLAPDYAPNGVALLEAESWRAAIAGRASVLGYNHYTAIRLITPLPPKDDVWTDCAYVNVTPRTMEAPDIIKIVVTRDGQAIAPVGSTFEAQEKTTRMGVKVVLHEGSIDFPMSAFDPGGKVIVTLIPAAGSNYVIALNDKQLRAIQ